MSTTPCLSTRATRCRTPSCVSTWPVGTSLCSSSSSHRAWLLLRSYSQKAMRRRSSATSLSTFTQAWTQDGELGQGEDLRAPRGEHHHRWQQRFRCPELLLPRNGLRRRPKVDIINSPATSARSSGTCPTGSRMSPPCLPAHNHVVHRPLRPGHAHRSRWRRTAATYHVAHVATGHPSVKLCTPTTLGLRRRPDVRHHQLVGNYGTVFVDQSGWQSAIAAKPASTHRGYLLSGRRWFTMPFALAMSQGRAGVGRHRPFAWPTLPRES